MNSNVDAVFINPFPEGRGLNDSTVVPPLGLAYMASVLEENGYTTKIIDANVFRWNVLKVISEIPEHIKLVGIYLNSFCYNYTLKLSNECKKAIGGSILILGGPLANVIPEQLLSEIKCDGVIRGEGEYAVLEIMNNISNGKKPFDENVSGAVYHNQDSGETVYNPIVRISDLDKIPFPAYHRLPRQNNYKSRARKRPVAAIITSRGCPYQCSFCSKDVFKRRITYRSAENVLSEIDFLVKEYSVRQLDVLDDNFTQKKERVEEIFDGLLQRNYDLAINFQSGVRVESLDRNLMTKMKRAGVYKLAFGIESANEEVLKRCNKSLNLEETKEIVRIAKELEILVYGFFIIGLPGETDEAFKQTMDFAIQMDFDVANFCMAMPFVGTELYKTIEKRGKFLVDMTRNIDTGFYGGDVFYELEDLKKETVIKRYKEAYKEFYSLRKSIQMLRNIRSLTELYWHINSVYFVIRGMLRGIGKSRSVV